MKLEVDEKRKAIIRIQTALLYKTREFFYKRGFYELMPVILSKCTDPLEPDRGSSVVKTGEIEYLGRKLKLTQSMILHKQLAISSGLDKIVIFSPNVRLEKPERRFSGRHSFEFTQVDFEVVYARKEDIFRLIEDFIIEVWSWIKKTCKDDLKILSRRLTVPEKPFKIYTTHEMVERYGEEWEIKASSSEKDPFWVICFKREFYDKEDPSNPGHFLNYDLIYPEGYGEGLSGGERETDFEKLRRRINLIKRNRSDFDLYLEFARKHLLPSAGVGFGIERMVRYLSGTPHIRDVQLFPRIPGEEIVF